jgi:hypothetical protein
MVLLLSSGNEMCQEGQIAAQNLVPDAAESLGKVAPYDRF